MRLKESKVAKYANGTAPLLGIPVFSLAEGRYSTALFRRQHLQVAISCPTIARIEYDEDAHMLVFYGAPGTEYRLINQATRLQMWQVRDELQSWARDKRRSVVSRTLSPELRRAAKIRQEIGKLERKRDRIRAHMPHSPVIPTSYELQPASESERRGEWEWREQKVIRRELGRLVRQPRKTWAAFYREVERIIGRQVDASRRHDRVCGRKRGPGIGEYLQHIYTYIGMTRKPYRGGDEDHGLDTFERHRRAQLEYLETMSERRSIESQIESFRRIVAELEGSGGETAAAA